MNKKKNFKNGLFYTIMAVLAVIIVFGIYYNRVFLRDLFRGLAYHPTSEMILLKTNLGLTNSGDLVFRSSSPELQEREEFNEHCRTVETSTAILGCYTNDKIYVYDIMDKRLDGIREATLAHELLHAVYARMSADERDSLKEVLDEVYNNNKDILGDELKIYSDNEQYEELYVRAGTEIKELPEKLEKHYGKIFKDQDVVASYYEKYASVFKELEEMINKMHEELTQLMSQIEAKKAEYEQRSASLNENIKQFNVCANTTGCFGSDQEFNSKRSELIAERDALNQMYDEISSLITIYNNKVNEYNKNVIYNRALNSTINSMAAPDEVE